MIQAMTVLTAEPHPNADRLKVYTLRASYDEPILQVCANLTNVYSVGNVVAVCLIGHAYDGMVIKSRKVRGVLSQGMMIGTTKAVSGSDVTDSFVIV